MEGAQIIKPSLSVSGELSTADGIQGNKKSEVSPAFLADVLPHRALSCITRFAAAGAQIEEPAPTREPGATHGVRDGSRR
jgi:hypothetical protein